MTRLEDVGIRLNKPPAEFRRIRHIEYLEGPLLTEFQIYPDGDPYLFIWRARDEEFNRWLAIRTTKRDIALYENRETTLRLMIERAVQAFLVDVDGQGISRRWFAVVIEGLPPSYVPENDSFYDPELKPRGNKDRRRGQAILINGEWDLQDIIEYSRKFRDVYSAEYLLSEEARKTARDSLFNYLLQGGWVYNTLFVQLSNTVPKEDRARLKTFQYSSPGIIEMDLNEDVATSVTHRVRELSPHIEDARSVYSEVYRWAVAQEKLNPPRKPIPTNAEVSLLLSDLTGMMGFIDLARLRTLTNDDLLQTAKIVLACFRRIDTLVRYHIDGKAKLVAELTAVDADVDEYDDSDDEQAELLTDNDDYEGDVDYGAGREPAYITAIRLKQGGITRVSYGSDPTGSFTDVDISTEEMIQLLEDGTLDVYVRDASSGKDLRVRVVRSISGQAYLKTAADSEIEDNLLKLPRY